MKFKLLHYSDLPRWDQFVKLSPQGSIFSTSVFLNALGCKYQAAVIENQGTIIAGIILARNEINAYSNPLFAKYLGVLLSAPHPDARHVNVLEKERGIISRIVDNLSPFKSFDYTFHPNFKNWMPFYWAGYQQETRYTFRLSDISDIATIKQNAHSRVKNDLRKAERSNLAFRSDIEVEDFYRVNSLSYKRQGGSPPYSFRKFSSLVDCLRGEDAVHLLGVSDCSGQLLAVAGVITDNKSSYLLFNGIDHRKPNVGANTKLIMDTIEYCSAFSPAFDFEGSMLKGVASFYQSFGAEQTPYFCIGRKTWQVWAKKRFVNAAKSIKYHR